MKWISTFGRFWYDFVVGDSVVLAIGGCAVIVIGTLLVWAGANAFTQIALPVIVVATLAASLRWPR
jgi:hypothetical protein